MFDALDLVKTHLMDQSACLETTRTSAVEIRVGILVSVVFLNPKHALLLLALSTDVRISLVVENPTINLDSVLEAELESV